MRKRIFLVLGLVALTVTFLETSLSLEAFGVQAPGLGAQALDPASPGQEPEAQPAAIDPDQKGDESEAKESEFVRQRMAWFHDQRAYPNKTLPPGIRSRAATERDSKDALEAALRLSLSRNAATPAVPAWTLIGPRPISAGGWAPPASGRIAALAVDPTNPKIVYAGGAEGGVWKTMNGGTTWTPLTDSQTSLAVGAIAIDPSNHNTIYAGTGEESFSGDSYYGAGILKSTNGGATWTRYAGAFTGGPCGGDWIGSIAVHPSNPLVLLAAVEPCYYGAPGIYRSADGGQTWTSVYDITTSWVPGTAVIFDHTNGNLAYAATYNGGGVLKSTDAGLHWVQSNGKGTNSLPTANVGRIALAMAPSNTSTLYAAIANSSDSNLLGLYKTMDGGNNWNQLTSTPNFCSTQCWYDIVLAVSPTNPNFVVAGGVYTYHPGGHAVMTSSDGGVTWVDESPGLHPDTHALAFTPDGSAMFVGNDGGVSSTSNPTANIITWTSLNSTLAIAEPYPGIAMDQGNVNHSYIGTQDNGTEKYSGALGWPAVACGDGGASIIDYSATSTVYTYCVGEDLQYALQKSTDDGNSWTSLTSGINWGDRHAWAPPLVIDPEHHGTLYFGSYLVYQSTNGATQWTAISGDLTNPNNTNHNSSLSTIAVAPTDANTVYTGSYDGVVFVSRNATLGTKSTWAEVSAGLPTSRAVAWIAVDPTNASRAIVGYSGFTGYPDSMGHVFATTNAGVSWTDISRNLPNTPVDAILVDPDAPTTIFIGTDIGAFYTTNGGTSWATLGTGLPNVVVVALGLHESSRTLRAATHGRSVWDLNIATLLPVPTISRLSPNTAVANAQALKLTVNGYQFNTKSVVVWNGAALATTFVSATQVTATIPGADLRGGGMAKVGVMNGAGGKLSNLMSFSITNPAPKLMALSKSTAVAGSPGFTLIVTGSGFTSTSRILWKGTALATTYISTTSLSSAIPATDLISAGTAAVSVLSPAPGGGTSTTLTFTISYPVPTVTSLSPTTAKAGSAAFSLTVTGTNFVKTSVVKWNGVVLATSSVSATRLTAAVPTADIAKAAKVPITVTNPAPGGGTSTQTVVFTVH